MLDDFLTRAALAGIGAALAAGPLGAFVVWRRMAYFGDATAHASILGVAVSVSLALPVLPGILVTAAAMALAVSALTRRGQPVDTLLGVAAHGALATGLCAAALAGNARISLDAYLFGDILAVSRADLATIWAGTVAVLALFAIRWQRLVTATLSHDLAHARGIDPAREQVLLALALALLVAVAIKVVGALLITALLILPAAAARPLSRTPETMAILAALTGAAAALAGLAASWRWDTPAGPSIVVAALIAFLASNLAQMVHGRRPA
jgi:zinc transport system permease protein